VASVAVSVDGGAWQTATGTTTWSWTWLTTAVANGTHTVAARATDTSGNVSTTSVTVTVGNDTAAPTVTVSSPNAGATVSGAVVLSGSATDDTAVASVTVSVDGGSWHPASGTTSWTYTWDSTTVADGSHTLTIQATDSSGKTTSAAEAVTVANASTQTAPPPPPPSTTAPNTQGTWVSPEGVTITVNSAGPWTIAQIYTILKANALDLAAIGPHYTIDVQDQYASQTQTGATLYAGRYTGYVATTYLQGVNSGFASRPDDVLTHEYGHAWSMYWLYTAHNGSWAGYENARWTTSDGSLTLATDSRTGTTYTWQVGEIIADDYRLLFGDSAAISERPTHMNTDIPDPRNVPGLLSYLQNTWRTP
jgi:hypothetical protein